MLLFLGGLLKRHDDTQHVAHLLRSCDKQTKQIDHSAFASRSQTDSTSSRLYLLSRFDTLKHQSVSRPLTFSTNIQLTFGRRARRNLSSSRLKSGFASISAPNPLPAPHSRVVLLNECNSLLVIRSGYFRGPLDQPGLNWISRRPTVNSWSMMTLEKHYFENIKVHGTLLILKVI